MRLLALVILLVAAAGCGNPLRPAPVPRADRPTPSAEESRAEGDARLARGDNAGAAQAYEQALRSDPENLAIRYLLGAALARADRVKEATAAFLWVVQHGSPDREEVGLARQWLAEAGATPAPSAPAAARGEGGGGGQLTGRTQWDDPQRGDLPLQILLDGDDPATRGKRYWAKVALNEPYQIAGVVPGRYRAMAQVGPVRLWDTAVHIKAESPTVLDLTPANSIAPPNALAPS
jgi:tetratricopeptide (TPR) repeat protein